MVIHFVKLRRALNHRDRGLITKSFNFFSYSYLIILIDPQYRRKFKWIRNIGSRKRKREKRERNNFEREDNLVFSNLE